MSNSIRDNVKDAIKENLAGRPFMDVDDVTCSIADSIFDALGICPDTQDLPADEIKVVAGYATSCWSVQDIHQRRKELDMHEWSDEKAQDFLCDYQDKISDVMVSGGWDAIDHLLCEGGN